MPGRLRVLVESLMLSTFDAILRVVVETAAFITLDEAAQLTTQLPWEQALAQLKERLMIVFGPVLLL